MALNDLTAVVVDDDENSLSFVVQVTKMVGLSVQSFVRPLDALNYVRSHMVDMMVTGFQMHQIDGMALIKETRKAHHDIPIVLVTTTENESLLKMNSSPGMVSDFFAKPFKAAELFGRVQHLANRRQYLKFLASYRLKEDCFKNHGRRVGHCSKILADALGWDVREQDVIFHGAQSHDMGMVSVPDSVFLKSGSLMDEKMGIVRMHTVIGRAMLAGNNNPFFETACVIAATHHERYNGSGYPNGLAGDSIPVAGRIVGLADVFDVLTSTRPYKQSWSFEAAFRFVTENPELNFDPEIVGVFERSADDIRGVYRAYAD